MEDAQRTGDLGGLLFFDVVAAFEFGDIFVESGNEEELALFEGVCA